MRLATFALVLVPAVLFGAENPYLGTWKLNPQKTTATGMPVPREMTVRFEADGDKVRRSVEGIDGEGKPITHAASVAWDGKEHETKGPNGSMGMVAVKRVNDHHNDVTVRENGKIIMTVRSIVSKDGKTMTNTIDGVNPKGQKWHAVEVLEKQ